SSRPKPAVKLSPKKTIRIVVATLFCAGSLANTCVEQKKKSIRKYLVVRIWFSHFKIAAKSLTSQVKNSQSFLRSISIFYPPRRLQSPVHPEVEKQHYSRLQQDLISPAPEPFAYSNTIFRSVATKNVQNFAHDISVLFSKIFNS